MTHLADPAPANEPRRVLLADANPHVRAALGLLLARDKGLTIVDQVADAHGLVSRAVLTQPHLLVLEWELPGSLGAETVAALRSICPGIEIVVLSVRPERRDEVLASGVGLFVSKSDPPARLLAAIRSALSGLEMVPRR